MIQINVALDLYSSAVCLILFAHLVVQNRRLRPDKLRSCFILMCAFNAAMSLCDITNWTCEGLANPWNPALLWSGSLLYCCLLYTSIYASAPVAASKSTLPAPCFRGE